MHYAVMWFWIIFYALVLALSQILLKLGLNQLGALEIKGLSQILPLTFSVIKNPFIVFGMTIMASSFIIWLFMLSWFKLSVIFPLTALVYVFVVVLSYFVLGEKLLLFNYLGVGLIAAGIFFLLCK